jgi:drug/metabolite transporter (DMT)-like permease
MFVGEMGCWLIVGLMSLYRRFVGMHSPTANGYEAVSADDAVQRDDSSDHHGTGESSGPAMKARNTSLLRGSRIVLLALPAVCDICGTTLMNAGLLLVAASIYQMTRGALVLFVGVFSVLFLRRHLRLFQWLSLAGVMLGVAVVGLAGAIWPDEKPWIPGSDGTVSTDTDEGLSDAVKAIIGVLLIAGGQIFTATQFVFEEWILENSPIEPIKVVGWEGIFGFSVTFLVMIILHFTVGRTESGQGGSFDIKAGWHQMRYQRELWVSSILIMISIG